MASDENVLKTILKVVVVVASVAVAVIEGIASLTDDKKEDGR